MIRAHRYEPDLNPAYQDFAEHYGVAILPARTRWRVTVYRCKYFRWYSSGMELRPRKIATLVRSRAIPA